MRARPIGVFRQRPYCASTTVTADGARGGGAWESNPPSTRKLRRATVLKTARPTGTRPPPGAVRLSLYQELVSAGGRATSTNPCTDVGASDAPAAAMAWVALLLGGLTLACGPCCDACAADAGGGRPVRGRAGDVPGGVRGGQGVPRPRRVCGLPVDRHGQDQRSRQPPGRSSGPVARDGRAAGRCRRRRPSADPVHAAPSSWPPVPARGHAGGANAHHGGRGGRRPRHSWPRRLSRGQPGGGAPRAGRLARSAGPLFAQRARRLARSISRSRFLARASSSSATRPVRPSSTWRWTAAPRRVSPELYAATMEITHAAAVPGLRRRAGAHRAAPRATRPSGASSPSPSATRPATTSRRAASRSPCSRARRRTSSRARRPPSSSQQFSADLRPDGRKLPIQLA